MKKLEKLDPEIFRKKVKILNEYLNTTQNDFCKLFDEGSNVARISIEQSIEKFYNQIKIPESNIEIPPVLPSNSDIID